MRTVLHRSSESDRLWAQEKQESWSVDEFEYPRLVLRLSKSLLSSQNKTAIFMLHSFAFPADVEVSNNITA